MKALLAAVAVIEFVVILWLGFAVNALPPVPAGPVDSLRGVEAGRARALLDPTAPPPATEVGVGVVAAEGTLVYGTVRADDGAPVTTGWVTFIDAEAQANSVRPDERGLWARTGVAAGKYVLKVQAEGFEPLEQELDVGEAGPLRVDLVVHRAVLVEICFVTPDGKPLLAALGTTTKDTKDTAVSLIKLASGLTAIATREPPPPRLPLTLLRTHTRFGAGEYRPSNTGFEPGEGGNGKLTVRGGLPVYVSACLRSEVISTVRLEAPTERLELVIDPSALLGLRSGVTFLLELEGTSELPERITADLSDRQSGGFNKVDVVDGRVTIRNSLPGAMQLTVWPGTGHERYITNLDLPAGRILDLGTLRLLPTLTQQVRVVDANGEPVPKAALMVEDRDRSWWEQSEQSGLFLFYADAEGKAALKLGPRRYFVSASAKDGRRGVADLDLTAGTRGGFTIRITEQGEVRVGFAESVRIGTRARAEDEAGRPLWGTTVSLPWPRTIKLPEGRYTLVVTDPDGVEVRTSFQVVIGKPAEITIR